MALLAVLSFALDRTAMTEIQWAAKGLISASFVVIGFTILLFLYFGAYAAYVGAAQHRV